MNKVRRQAQQALLQGRVAFSILAGGLSTRMGRDKARLRLGRHSLLGLVRASARKTGWPVRVIRRDLVARCGPLGGVYTALKTSRADAELFLACDMPFVSVGLLARLLSGLGPRRDAVFSAFDGSASFPFLVRVRALPIVEKQIRRKRFSVQSLARALRAKLIRLPRHDQAELVNINTPGDWKSARKLLRKHIPTARKRVLSADGRRST